jgi:hypothetical protein
VVRPHSISVRNALKNCLQGLARKEFEQPARNGAAFHMRHTCRSFTLMTSEPNAALLQSMAGKLLFEYSRQSTEPAELDSQSGSA